MQAYLCQAGFLISFEFSWIFLASRINTFFGAILKLINTSRLKFINLFITSHFPCSFNKVITSFKLCIYVCSIFTEVGVDFF